MGRQVSHDGPGYDGVSEPHRDSENGNPAEGSTTVALPQPGVNVAPGGTRIGHIPQQSPKTLADVEQGAASVPPVRPESVPGRIQVAGDSDIESGQSPRDGANAPENQPMQPQTPSSVPGDSASSGSEAGTPNAGGTYGQASVPLNTVRPTSATPVPEIGEAAAKAPVGGVASPADSTSPADSQGALDMRNPALSPAAGSTAVTNDGAGPGAASTRAKTRTKWVVALGVVVFLVLAAGVVALVRPGPVDGWLSADPTSRPTPAPATPDPSPTPVLVAASGGGTALTAQGVTAAIDPLVKSPALGTKVHVSVVDVASGEVLYARNADTMTTPASTTKLLTAAAVLDARGPSYRLSTRVVAGNEPGEVVLIGGGDPTLATTKNSLFPGAARLDLLAAQVTKSLGGVAPTRLVYDTSLFGGAETARGWDSTDISSGHVSRVQALMVNAGRVRPIHNQLGGDPRSGDPANAAAKAFARLLGVPPSAVRKGRAPAEPSSAASSAPASEPTAAPAAVVPGRQLAMVQSPPMVQLTDWMLERSDNTAAEALGRHVALADGRAGTFDDATEAILSRMGDLGLPADEATLYDASGLSRHNGISPTLLTQLLSLAASGKKPALSAIFSGLPVAGWSGTMHKRFVSPKPNQAGQGVVRGKTGTLSGVNTMAGTLATADGRLLVFAIMASGSANAVTGRAALDSVLVKLAACGC